MIPIIRKLLFTAAFLLSLQSFGQEVDCEELYNEAKEKFEKNFGDASGVDYSGLGKTILENLDMGKFTERNLVLYISNISESCLSGIPKTLAEYLKILHIDLMKKDCGLLIRS